MRLWAIDAVMMPRLGSYGLAHNTDTTDACDLEWAGRRVSVPIEVDTAAQVQADLESRRDAAE